MSQDVKFGTAGKDVIVIMAGCTMKAVLKLGNNEHRSMKMDMIDELDGSTHLLELMYIQPDAS
jgi:hypothetical protein